MRKLIFLLFMVSNFATVNAQQLFKDIFSGPTDAFQASPVPFCNSNGVMFFEAINSFGTGLELWKTDGTSSGTILVKDINTGANSSFIKHLTNVNGTLYFTANTDASNTAYELWKSDGTAQGTVMVKEINPTAFGSFPKNFIAYNGNLFFTADDGTNGKELWKSDGTAQGTVMVKDIYVGSSGGDPQNMTIYNNELYFQANGGFTSTSNGETLWKTNGTTNGTVMVSTSSKPQFPSELVVSNSQLFFAAGNNANGKELWKTDGTNLGTTMIKDINVGATNHSNPRQLIDVNNLLLFYANDGTNGIELWKSDGTLTGTTMIKDIRAGSNSSYVLPYTNINTVCKIANVLFFKADDGINGEEIWKTDGTFAGTTLLKDIRVGVGSSNPQYYTSYNNKLYFSAFEDINGTELWTSDGTTSGTILVQDIFIGSSGSSPKSMNVFNNNLYFDASTFNNGRELWRFTASNLAVKSNDLMTQKITIYPNPASSILNISLSNNSEISKITITDLSGKKILEQVGNKTAINIESLAKGMYVLEALSDGNKMAEKFVKQ